MEDLRDPGEAGRPQDAEHDADEPDLDAGWGATGWAGETAREARETDGSEQGWGATGFVPDPGPGRDADEQDVGGGWGATGWAGGTAREARETDGSEQGWGATGFAGAADDDEAKGVDRPSGG